MVPSVGAKPPRPLDPLMLFSVNSHSEYKYSTAFKDNSRDNSTMY